MFEKFNQEKPFFCCIPCNGYKCFVHKQNDKLGTVLKTTIDFVYTVEGIDYIVGAYTLESSNQVSKLLFKEELLAERVEQSGTIDNYFPVLCWCTKLISDCWFREVCLSNLTQEYV